VRGRADPHAGRRAAAWPRRGCWRRDDGRLLAYSANWASEQEARDALAQLPDDSGPLQSGNGPAWIGTLQLAGRGHDVAAHRQGRGA
jgi:hypothetical protein